VTVEGNVLRVRGEKRRDREHVARDYYLMERAYGSFERAVELPPSVDGDRARATFRNGVLTVELPKTGERRRLVPVK
jgi:HSP20 family protein